MTLPSGDAAPSSRLAFTAMACAATFWSSGLIVTKLLVRSLTVAEVFAGQLILASVVLWGLLLATRTSPSLGRSLSLRMITMGLMAPGLVNLLTVMGASRTSGVNVVVIFAMLPLVIPVLGRLFLAEPLRPEVVVGVLLGFSGTLLLVSQRQHTVGDIGGDLLIALAVVFSAANMLLARRVNQATDKVMVVATIQVTSASVVGLVALAAMGAPSLAAARIDTGTLLLLGYLALFSTVFVFLLYNFALRRLPVAYVGLFFSLVPALGTVLAALLLGEPVGPLEVAGVLTVMIAVGLPAVVSLRRQAARKRGRP